MSDGPAIKETIVLEIQTPQKGGKGLGELLTELKAVDKHIDAINAKVAGGVAIPAALTRTEAEIKKHLRGVTTNLIKPEDAAKMLGLDPAMLRNALTRVKAQIQKEFSQFRPGTLSFESLPSATKGIHLALQAEVKALEAARSNIWKGLGSRATPAVGAVKAAGDKVTTTVEGAIPLVIPAVQVQASVIGEVKLLVPGAQVAAGGATRNEKGQFVAGTGGAQAAAAVTPAVGGKPKGSGKTYVQPGKAGEFERTVTYDSKGRPKLESIRFADGAGSLVTETYDAVDNALKKRLKNTKTGLRR